MKSCSIPAWTLSVVVANFAWLSVAGTTVCLAQGTMYACQSSREFYTVNLGTGAKTLLGSISANVTISASLTYDCTTQTAYVSSTFAFAGVSKNIYTLNIATRQATLIGPYGDPAILMHAIEINPHTGVLYGVSIHNHGLYSINRTTGAATLIGLTGIPIGATTFDSLGYNPDDGIMYLANTGTLSLYKVVLATGEASLIGPLNGPVGIGAMAYNIDNHTMYLVDNDGDVLYTVNLSTGAATPIGPTGAGNLIGLVYVTPTCPPPPNVPGDTNGDGIVNIDDLVAVITSWGRCPPPPTTCPADVNHNGVVDIDDLVLVITNWG